MYSEPGMQINNYQPLIVAAAKGFVKAGAGETKFGSKVSTAGGGDAGGHAVLTCTQEDPEILKTGFILADWNPALMSALAGEL